jgi:hypothetical protein
MAGRRADACILRRRVLRPHRHRHVVRSRQEVCKCASGGGLLG